jgi:hypothetical protein
MKPHERILLNHLESATSQKQLLINTKTAMGSLAHMQGNPLTKTEITLNVDTFIYDINFGALIPGIALPANLQTSVPIFIFGLTDYYGGYNKLRILIPPRFGWFRNIVNETIGIFGSSCWIAGGFNPVGFFNNNASSGDMFYSWFDNPNVPLYKTFVRIRCQNIAFGTFFNSFVSDLITINTLRLIVPIANIIQYSNPLIFGYQTLFGKTSTDNIDPRLYITNTDFQQQICDIPINLPIDKNVMLGFQMNVTCQSESIILFVDKIEPLTHK